MHAARIEEEQRAIAEIDAGLRTLGVAVAIEPSLAVQVRDVDDSIDPIPFVPSTPAVRGKYKPKHPEGRVEDLVLAVVNRAGRAVNAGDVRQQIGAPKPPRPSILTALSVLCRDKKIERVAPGLYRALGAAVTGKQPKRVRLEARILAVFQGAPSGTTFRAADLREKIAPPAPKYSDSMYAALSVLKKHGDIERVSEGLYRLATKVPQ